MPSPFPGMDPFVEINPRWEALHAWFFRELARTALPAAKARGCWIDVEKDIYRPSHRQQYLVVRDNLKSSRELAVVELLSPANKSGAYVPKYHEKRINLIASSAHFLEIDLLRAGRNPLRERLPELPRTPYLIFLARQLRPDRKEEAYPVPLQEPLPVINLPLSEGRSDLPLDLGAAFRSAYDLSIRRIDYPTEPVPEPPLEPADEAWLNQLLARQAVGHN